MWQTIIFQKNKTTKFEDLNINKFESDLRLGITTSLIVIKHVTKFMKKQKQFYANSGSDLSIISLIMKYMMVYKT